MIAAFILNWIIIVEEPSLIFTLLLIGQVSFYSMALLGWFFESRQVKVKLLFIPYYFCMMNWAVLAGIARYLKGNQSVLWEKAGRKMS